MTSTTRGPRSAIHHTNTRPRWQRRAVFLLSGVVGLLVLAGCSSTKSSAATLTIHASDFRLQLSRQTVPAGTVHVVFINDSKDYIHEVFVYPQTQPGLPAMLAEKQAGQDVDEPTVLQGLAGHVEDVPPGKQATFDATLTPGTYELGCFVTSDIAGTKHVHYSDGMHALLTVQ